MKKYLIILVFLFCTKVSFSQLPRMSFSELERSILETGSDTVYVVNFWATWCGPCVKELPNFNAVQDSLKGENVKYIFASADFPNKEARVDSFFTKTNLEGEVLMLHEPNPNEWINKMDPEWQGNIPATWFVNPKTKAHYFHIGTIETIELIKQINNLN